jgi:DNA primase
LYDVFRNRIIFPILDEQERIVGFGGRTMSEDVPKYLNTGETPLFAKSKLLYGLPFARRKIASEERTLLMEGYTDVIAAHQAGFANAVATLGTSLTEEHARKLARLAANGTVVLVYDADNAGIKATLRASEILETEGVQVRVARLPAGEDPDSLLKKGDVAGFQGAIDRAAGRVEYQLERIVEASDSKDDSGKRLMLRQIVEILASIPTRSERDVYVSKMWRFHPMSSHGPSVASEQLHRDAEARAGRKRGGAGTGGSGDADPPARMDPGYSYGRQGEYRRRGKGRWEDDGRPRWREDERGRGGFRRSYRSAGPIEPPPKVTPGPTTEERAEKELLRALVEPEWRETVLKHMRPDDLLSEDARRFARFVEQYQAELGEDATALAVVLDRREDGEFSLRIRQQLQEISALAVKVPVNEAAIIGCAATLRRHREIELVQKRLSELLQSKPVVSAEDQEQVRAYQAILRKLKGSGTLEGVQGE